MYDPNAFGNPDGSRTEIADMMSEFVVFEKKYFSSGVASPDDLKTRVIVGAKGAGKTVYLRRLQANLKLNDSVYVTYRARSSTDGTDCEVWTVISR